MSMTYGAMFLVPLVIGLLTGGILMAPTPIQTQSAASTTQKLVVTGAPKIASSPVLYSLPEQTVGLTGSQSVRARLILEMSDQNASPASTIAAYRARVDEVNRELREQSSNINQTVAQILSTKSASDMASSEGKQALKDEIREKLNAALGHDGVSSVHLSELTIQ